MERTGQRQAERRDSKERDRFSRLHSETANAIQINLASPTPCHRAEYFSPDMFTALLGTLGTMASTLWTTERATRSFDGRATRALDSRATRVVDSRATMTVDLWAALNYGRKSTQG